MKKSLLLLGMLPIAAFAQQSVVDSAVAVTSADGVYPNTFSSGSANVHKFDNNSRLFRDWSISVGGGTALMAKADLISVYDKKVNWGWTAYASLDKQISHSFGLSLQYDMGKTTQKGQVLVPEIAAKAGVGTATTEFKSVSLLGDINFSNILRRVDNHSPYRWALHGYAGIGFLDYDTHLDDGISHKYHIEVHQKLDIGSFFLQAGLGLKYNINKFMDIEGRVMYVKSGDEEFDGGGWDRSSYPYYNLINDSYSDDMVTGTLGLSFKLGKHDTHLQWYDPLMDINNRILVLENKPNNAEVCEKGDNDNDGVCDDWDRQLDTPAGARVDGAGVALDMDLDGVIDLYDKCVTVPGPQENNGCPTAPAPVALDNKKSITEINTEFEGIEFELNSDKIRPVSYGKLDNAAKIIKTLDASQHFLVVGATDTRGSEVYNQKLSERRAAAVMKYLLGKGVSASMLTSEGRGETDLKYPECNPAEKCEEFKNLANRRVFFEQK